MAVVEARPPTPAGQVYQLKVTLLEVVPRIWRRFQVTGDMKLSALHRTLQAVMGWENSHLHRFDIQGVDIQGVEYGNGPGSCNEDPALEEVVAPRLDVRQSQVRRPWDSVPTVFFYEYDFGDSWGHELRVEKVSKPNPRFSFPRCLAGARACPPEDCGGPPGYHALVEEVAAARFDRRLGRRGDRSGGDDDGGEPARLFDPGRFDLERINKQLGGAPRRRERRPEMGVEEPVDAIRGAFAQRVRGACSMVRESLLTDDVGTLATAQQAYLTTMLGLLARVGLPERVDPSLAQAALAEIRSPEVAPVLHELQDLGERLRQHINRIDGPRRRPR